MLEELTGGREKRVHAIADHAEKHGASADIDTATNGKVSRAGPGQRVSID